MKNILLWLWIVLIIIILYNAIKKEKNNKTEAFTPKIRSYYRPYLRDLRLSMETFQNYFPVEYFTKKLGGPK